MTMPSRTFALRTFTEEEQREIVFKQVDDESFSHMTRLDGDIVPTPQNVIGFFVNSIRRDARLVSGFDVLFGKLKTFIGERLFGRPVDLEDRNVLRNLSIPEVTQAIRDAFKSAINALIVVDRGDSRIQTTRKLSEVDPAVVARQSDYRPRRASSIALSATARSNSTSPRRSINFPTLCPSLATARASRSRSSIKRQMDVSQTISPTSSSGPATASS
jgi:hypothetical protein